MSVQLEFAQLVVPLDGNLEATLQAKVKDGWGLIPGSVPIVSYQLFRPIQQTQTPEMHAQGFAKMTIDESKVYVIDKDGNKVER
jgi:hypothetical protein